MSTTQDAARAMRELFGLPDTEPPTDFTAAPACAPIVEDVDPELIDLAHLADSAAREHAASEAAADAIEKAKAEK